jgi:hypothetical protein
MDQFKIRLMVEDDLPGANALRQIVGWNLLRELRDRPAYWDVPDHNAAALATARDCGFSPVRPLTRMRLGLEIVATNPRSQFAIADLAVS